ncbi:MULTISPECIES: ABC transporter ATP-binding protein [Haloferax]|uniref:Putative sugar ABC transporter ATP-binding protein n=1 Tax=Haloferax lucentense (strain DSM 14919 / JCM 9276 / NCIMB 13854 / Aa 2.2) TaxID=1230452 RepID=M0GX06_HALL2|nr:MULTISPECIES: ABC transporter ATP-binding protein [Haloferax]ELZ75394.1 putative sugar ABC transporter ATP-binding protein [Haloferax lucentense DSM 14919]MBC9986737.1 ABC transporter ATP-binding protein [Haloferax sp. AS1]RDZ35321.1 ABC transporter ATP-binding protein [Haloferax sp. Atlit-24N]RLM35732.1 ABC transporter ATP-binding protein [Haloferax sp. Atlit-109R]RLM43579.1 ABC transporter ATP-binding protein [Haloferax sp. Atlit-105R]
MTDTTAPAVQLTDITKRFGDVVANDSVDLTLDRGSIHAVIGENGAGKTTLMNVLYGLYDPNEGTIAVDGEPRSFDSPRDAIAAGIGMIHQHFQLVDNMTVLQNIVLGHEPSTRGLVDEQAARRRITDICDTYGFSVDEHLDTPIEELGLGIQQHVEIVKSLYRGADTLILDEPTAVLTPQEVEGLFDVMEALTADGRSLIFITHKLDEAMHAADDITVLRDGSAVGTVDAAATSQNELARMMVGREVLFDVDSRGGTPGEVALTVDGVTVRDERGLEQVRDVSLSVREGEILGIAGVEGNGQQELIEAITGMRTPERGTVSLQGRDITELSRRRRIEDGISYVPGDRLEEGLVQDYSLVRNALLSNQTMDAFSDGLFLDWQRIGDHADEIIEAYDVRPRNPEATAKSLSGGNQQKFIVGRELERDPSVLVAAHPTRGVDIGSIEFIHQRFQDMRAEGVAILLVSSKLDEVQKLSDRTAVMYEGSVVDTVDPDDVTEEELGLLMAGRTRDGTERAARGAEGDA